MINERKTLTSRDDIMRCATQAPVEFDVPEWGCRVLLSVVSGVNREKWEREASKTPQPNNIRARLVACAIVDENGKRIFNDNEIDLLNEKNWAGLNRIYQAIAYTNLIKDPNIEEEAKN